MGNARASQRQLQARFKAAHKDGMASLKAHDYDGLRDAVERERLIIDEQSDAIARNRAKIAQALSVVRKELAKRKPR